MEKETMKKKLLNFYRRKISIYLYNRKKIQKMIVKVC